MNKTKRGLQLAAAITSIAFAGVLIIGSILILALIQDLISAGMESGPEYSVIQLSYILIILLSVAIIIISAFICKRPNEKMHKGLCITDLILNAVLAVLYIIAGSLWLLLPLAVVGLFIAVVGLFIAELCIKTKVNSNKTATLNETDANLSSIEGSSKTENSSNSKIEKIKELNKQGVLSDEEMKTLIIDELKKD